MTHERHSETSTNVDHRQIAWLLLGLILPTCGLAPLLFLIAIELWSQLPYRFFPISIVAGIVLLLGTCDYRSASPRRSMVSTFLVLAGMGIGLWGMYYLSTIRAHLAIIVIVTGWALRAFGGTSWTRVMAICLLFAETLPLPRALSTQIMRLQQHAAAWASNGFLEAIYVPNVVEVSVLQAEGIRLPVFETCFDAGGCFALLAFAFVWTIWWHRPFLVSSVVLISVFFWSIAGDFIRLISLVLIHRYFGMDHSVGIASTVLGSAVFALLVLCVILFNQSIAALLEPIELGPDASRIQRAYQRLVTWPVNSLNMSTPPKATSTRQRFLLGAFNLVCLSIGIVSMWILFIKPQPRNRVQAMSTEQAQAFVTEDAIPEQFGNFKRIRHVMEARPVGNVLGRFTHVWQYDGGDTQLVVSLDFPFVGWNSPTVGYQLMGWKVEESKKIEMNSNVHWFIEEVKLKNRLNITANSWSAMFNEMGEPIDESVMSKLGVRENIVSMLNANDAKTVLPRNFFQFRLFFETGRELREAEENQFRELFVELIDRVRQQCLVSLPYLN